MLNYYYGSFQLDKQYFLVPVSFQSIFIFSFIQTNRLFSFLPKLDFSETLFFDKKVKILFHFFQQKIEVEKNHSNEVLSQFLRMLIASRER